MSRVGVPKAAQADDYMQSQTFFMKNEKIREMNKQMRQSQEYHAHHLSRPKRNVPKFFRLTQTENVNRKSINTFSDKLFA